MRRWIEYVQELFDDDRGDKPEAMDHLSGSEIMQKEVRETVSEMKTEKAWCGGGDVGGCGRGWHPEANSVG